MDKLIKEVEATVSPVYLVGGGVRDIILNREPKDYDFCTPLTPDEVEVLVKAAGRRAYSTGKRFGTIGFKCAGEFIEVTTFRNEKYAPNSRKPEVEFVSDLKSDLSRRDFTMNAVALRNGEFFDPFGGRLDILAKNIKCVGNAKDRFKEDPLRMLRAARFCVQLDFQIDPNAIGVMSKMSEYITLVSRERWVQELDKLLIADHYEKGLKVLYETKLMLYILPELYIITNKQTIADILCNIGHANADADTRWCELLRYVGIGFTHTYNRYVSYELAVGICERLKFSNIRTQKILDAIKH